MQPNDIPSSEPEDVPKPRRRGSVRKAASSAGQVLISTGTPVWFTILALAIGSAGTYFLSPRISAALEAQRIRTQFVVTSMADLKKAASGLLKSIALMNQHMMHQRDISDDVDAVLANMSELQGLMLATQFMVTAKEHEEIVIDFYKASMDFQISLYEQLDAYAAAPQNAADITTQTVPTLQKLSMAIARLFQAIGEIGGLRPQAAE